MDELIQELKKVLANEFAFFLKAQNFHWNVEGPDFFQYHELFGKIYTEVYDSIDVLAEQIRALGAYSPGSFTRFQQLADIEDQVEIPSSKSMMEILLADNDKIQANLERCFELAEAQHKHGLSDVIAGRQDAHAKHGWMLRATLKNR